MANEEVVGLRAPVSTRAGGGVVDAGGAGEVSGHYRHGVAESEQLERGF